MRIFPFVSALLLLTAIFCYWHAEYGTAAVCAWCSGLAAGTGFGLWNMQRYLRRRYL